MVSGEENLIKEARVSLVWALAAALAIMCMILSREASLQNTQNTDFKLTGWIVPTITNTWKVKFCLCEVPERSRRCQQCTHTHTHTHTPADMDAGGQTPCSLPFWCGGLLQNLAGHAEGRSCQLHGQKHHTLALQERQLQQITSHPHHLQAQMILKILENNLGDRMRNWTTQTHTADLP